jgi:hypothetical protein
MLLCFCALQTLRRAAGGTALTLEAEQTAALANKVQHTTYYYSCHH